MARKTPKVTRENGLIEIPMSEGAKRILRASQQKKKPGKQRTQAIRAEERRAFERLLRGK